MARLCMGGTLRQPSVSYGWVNKHWRTQQRRWQTCSYTDCCPRPFMIQLMPEGRWQEVSKCDTRNLWRTVESTTPLSSLDKMTIVWTSIKLRCAKHNYRTVWIRLDFCERPSRPCGVEDNCCNWVILYNQNCDFLRWEKCSAMSPVYHLLFVLHTFF